MKVIALTIFQKVLLSVPVAMLAGAGVYEVHQNAQLQKQVRTLQTHQASLTAEIRRLQQEHDDVAGSVETLSAENARLKSNQHAAELLSLRGKVTQFEVEEKDPVNSAAKDWLANVNKLKQRLEVSPDASIPELQFATDEDWLDAVKKGLNTEVDYRRALASVRGAGQWKFAGILQGALLKYANANNRQFPDSVTQLRPYFDTPVDDAMLERYQIVSGKEVPLGGTAITQKTTPDELFDSRNIISFQGYSGGPNFLDLESTLILGPVYQAFKDANKGSWPQNTEQLKPFATSPEEVTLINKIVERDALAKSNVGM